jgi:putative heme degradation protein
MPTRNDMSHDWLRVVRSEYLEMPGLHLTAAQMRRLWGFDQVTCDDVVTSLTAVKFLRRTANDGYILATHER